eukprot:1174898-Amphidinium_carterae.4
MASKPRGDRTQEPSEAAVRAGDQVCSYISLAPRCRTKRWWVHRWVGAAVVLGFERVSAWLSCKRRLRKVARYHISMIRPASVEERMHWEQMAADMYDLATKDPLEKTRKNTHRFEDAWDENYGVKFPTFADGSAQQQDRPQEPIPMAVDEGERT